MRIVNEFESRLLHLLRYFVGGRSGKKALAALENRLPMPEGLSDDCVDLVQNDLAAGLVKWLATRPSAWQARTYLRDGQAVRGRLWERFSSAELRLEFSANSLEFLIWATGQSGARDDVWKLDEPLTYADQLLLFLAYRRVRSRKIGRAWRRMPPFRDNLLCRLFFAADFDIGESNSIESIESWTCPPRVTALEALQDEMAAAWIQMERDKRKITLPARMLAVGRAQSATMQSFLIAIDQGGRRDLSRFILQATGTLAVAKATAKDWTGNVLVEGLTVGQRLEVETAAFAFFNAFATLEQWQHDAMAIGYFDDGYAASQLWKSDWDFYQGAQRGSEIRRIQGAAQSGLAGWEA